MAGVFDFQVAVNFDLPRAPNSPNNLVILCKPRLVNDWILPESGQGDGLQLTGSQLQSTENNTVEVSFTQAKIVMAGWTGYPRGRITVKSR